MPHISITLLPGRSSEQKKSLAKEVRRTLACELGIDPLLVSVSVIDLPLEQWNGFLAGLPDDSIIIPENENDYEKSKKNSCHCC